MVSYCRNALHLSQTWRDLVLSRSTLSLRAPRTSSTWWALQCLTNANSNTMLNTMLHTMLNTFPFAKHLGALFLLESVSLLALCAHSSYSTALQLLLQVFSYDDIASLPNNHTVVGITEICSGFELWSMTRPLLCCGKSSISLWEQHRKRVSLLCLEMIRSTWTSSVMASWDSRLLWGVRWVEVLGCTRWSICRPIVIANEPLLTWHSCCET